MLHCSVRCDDVSNVGTHNMMRLCELTNERYTRRRAVCSCGDLSESQTSDIVDLFNDFWVEFLSQEFYDDPLASDLASLNISDVRDVECATSLAMILVGYL